jgi:hypothetical protein
MRPEEITHRAERRVDDIVIKAGNAHSLFRTLCFPMPSGRSLSSWSLARGCHFGLVTWSIPKEDSVEVKHRHRHPELYYWEISSRSIAAGTTVNDLLQDRRNGQNRRRKSPAANLGRTRRPTIPNTRRAKPSAQTQKMTIIDYKGYRIEVCPVGKGWREHLSFRQVRPLHGQIVRSILKKVAGRRLLPRPSALSRCASVHDFYKNCASARSQFRHYPVRR